MPSDPWIKNLPNTRSTGDWVEINGLKSGTYTLEFGGTDHIVADKMTNATIFAEALPPGVPIWRPMRQCAITYDSGGC